MYQFDDVIDRNGTRSLKWDDRRRFFEDRDVLPLWVADMDFASPPCVTEALVKRAQHPIYGYPSKPAELNQALIGWMKRRFDVEVKEGWLATVPGIVPGLHFAIDALTEPDEKVIVQTPVYQPFYQAVRNRGRQLIENPLIEVDGDYQMDFDDLRRKIDEKTRMLILCSPHNPVGRVWRKNELMTLAEICLEHDIIVVSDEIHSDLVYEKGSHTPFYSLSPEIADKSLTFVAPSKTFNLAGLFSSFVISPNARMLRQFQVAMSRTGVEFINMFGIEAMTAAYQGGDEWLDQLLVYLRGNADYIRQFLQEHVPQVTMRVPQATYLGWMDFRQLGLPPAEIKRLMIHEALLGLNDGTGFGEAGAGFQRINFACPRSTLEEAMHRLERTFQPLG
ncbi:putative C-S lyase [Brevibacillus fluminis]|uniref:cysteine-S-conjugate beta-lyase n=1 Tax=Brevibacillus fluminis TaxID=511487 RepID=A0A3M8DTJ5_9BACL|nr:PatB family C-S lyase [Brevibacillus fluminis]RNB91426.1 putative C-S lyase [Brevibacillus fluminis]